VHVPGHPDEVETLLRAAARTDDRQYVRLSSLSNPAPLPADGRVHLVRDGAGPLVLVVGPLLGTALEALADVDAAVAYTATPWPLDAAGLRHLLAGRRRLVVVEPYLQAATAPQVLAALGGDPVGLTFVGVPPVEARRYGSPKHHATLHGLDAPGIRDRVLAAA